MYLEIALPILVSILIVLVILCIPVVIQIWRISKDISITQQTLNQSLPLILKNLEEITTHVNHSTSLVNKKIQSLTSTPHVSGVVLADIINNIQYLAPLVLKLPIFHIIKNIVAVAKGMRIFTEVLLNKEKNETLK
ncbi:MAG: hypothetical protein JW925_06350 [Syntrophaceae bacterium]|nr:hypothetical protein [Syntrophaceae bacterium]